MATTSNPSGTVDDGPRGALGLIGLDVVAISKSPHAVGKNGRERRAGVSYCLTNVASPSTCTESTMATMAASVGADCPS